MPSHVMAQRLVSYLLECIDAKGLEEQRKVSILCDSRIG
jgi:hypothetical protein